MLSDIHFDPFHDPAKFAQLNAAPAAQWPAILATPASATQAADFADLQKACKSKGVDTPIALYTSALQAMHTRLPHPLFVTISGDLMAHQFDCRYKQLAHTDAGYSAFAARTVAFVSLALHATYPGTPLYFALGNNDSGCGDYEEDPNSAFLTSDGQAFAANSLAKKNAAAYRRDFAQYGEASLELPRPFHQARLLILQNIFESKRYAGCDAKPSTDPSTQQIAWLRTQLEAATKAHESVWIMAHIPPGIDAYSTFSGGRNVCGGDKPVTFLASNDFGKLLSDYAATIRLVLLGHTHMDEMRLYTGNNGAAAPGKLVPSITPVNGNNPAFTIGQVDPATAQLSDYEVYAANNQTGADTQWNETYRFSTTYQQSSFSGATVSTLMTGFLADKTGSTPASQAYENNYFVGAPAFGMKGASKAMALSIVWPGYACSIAHTGEKEFRDCLCPAAP